MKSAISKSFNRAAIVAGVGALGLVAATMIPHVGGSSFELVAAANAAEKGAGGEKGHGKRGAGTSGSAATGGSTGKGGKPAGTGGGQVSGSKVGRLNMARAFVSPGFDIANVDDPAAPIAQIALYKDVVTDEYSPEALDVAGTALGNAATVNPVTLDTVTKINTILQVDTTWTTDQLTALAAKATEVLVARRTEEGEE